MIFRANIIWMTLAASTVFVPIAFAENVVKIYSEKCSQFPDNRDRMEGSGLLLEHQQEKFILTSSHVVYHDFAGHCHSAYIGSTWRDLKLVAVNFANGLALLKLNDQSFQSPKTDFYPWTRMETTLNKLNQNHDRPSHASLSGFRFQSMTYLNLKDQLIRSWDSQGSILPLAPQLIEIEGPTEYGMSGGPVMGAFADSETPEFLGMISHHYFSLQEGQPPILRARLGQYFPGLFSNLVIPLTVIVPWLEQVWQGDARHSLAYDATAMEQGSIKVAVAGLAIVERSCQFGVSAVGGGQGVGIGGGQGVGVGGSTTTSIGNVCNLEFSLSPQSTEADRSISTLPGWQESILPELGRVKDKLLQMPPSEQILFSTKFHYANQDIMLQSMNHMFSGLSRHAALYVMTKHEYDQSIKQQQQTSVAACKNPIPGIAESVPGGCLDVSRQWVWGSVSINPKSGSDVDGVCQTYGSKDFGWRMPSTNELASLGSSGFWYKHLSINSSDEFWAALEISSLITTTHDHQVHGRRCRRMFANFRDQVFGGIDVTNISYSNNSIQFERLNTSVKKNVICIRSLTPSEETVRSMRENQEVLPFCQDSVSQ